MKVEQGSCSSSWPRDGQHELLCRLHLEALAKLASTHNPVVHARLHELRAPQFLVREVLGAGGFSGNSTHRSVEASVDQARELNQSLRSLGRLPVESNTDTVFNDEPNLGHPMMKSVTRSARETASSLPFQVGTVRHSVHQEGRVNVQVASDVHYCTDSATFIEPHERCASLHDMPAVYVSPPAATGIADDPVICRDKIGSGSGAKDEPERPVRGTASTELENAEAGSGVVRFAVGDTVDGLVNVRRGRPRWFTG